MTGFNFILIVFCLLLVGLLVLGSRLLLKIESQLRRYKVISKRYERRLELLSEWIENRNNGKTIARYVKDTYNSPVGIYGLGQIGKLLIRELRAARIDIVYIIDKRAEQKQESFEGIPVIPLKSIVDIPGTGVVIITILYDFFIENTINELKEGIQVDFIHEIVRKVGRSVSHQE